jgi:hypothetical protein
MDISIIVSKSTLNKLDQFLNYHHNDTVRRLEENYQISLQPYLINEKKTKSLISNQRKERCQRYCHNSYCLARVWNSGYGGQCQRARKEGDYCLAHFKQLKNGHLPHGRIDMPCPKILTKLTVQPFGPIKKIKVKEKGF